MNKKIQSALISVYYKEGLDNIVKLLSRLGVTIYSTGGTQQYIEKLGVKVVPVEDLTTYPSILGGRVKTLHPSVFGGILGRRDSESDVKEMKQFNIPSIDLVIVDLYPFEETVAAAASLTGDKNEAEKTIIEKIDIGGPSLIRSAAKNYKDVIVIAAKKEYAELEKLLNDQNGETTIEQRRGLASRAFEVVAHYDVVIAKYFNPENSLYFLESVNNPKALRYGENPHQAGVFYGKTEELFNQLHGKELSYNNLVDIDAAIQLINEFKPVHSIGMNLKEGLPDTKGQPKELTSHDEEVVFAIIKHTNVCGIAKGKNVKESWESALAGDPESAFGGVLICNYAIDKTTAEAIQEIFFEVLIAPAFEEDALVVLKSKKNRILLQVKPVPVPKTIGIKTYRSLLNGVLAQQVDEGNYAEWKEAGGRETTPSEKKDLEFANLVCKHLKSNAIALVKDSQLIGKGCGQTSRIDALRQALEKATQFKFNLKNAVLASDAFFPFDDCVKIGHEAGITAFIQPGGSIRDKDSIDYCKTNNLAMVMSGMRHFKH